MTNPFIGTIQIKGKTTSEWDRLDPVLLDREPALDTTTGLVKYGDGVRTWSQIPYPASVAGVTVVATLADPSPIKALAANQGAVITDSLAIANNASANAVAAASAAAVAAASANGTATAASAAATTATSSVATLTTSLSGKADKAGATFTGAVIVPTPTLSTHATTKAYVDSAVAGVNTGLPTTTTFAQAIPFDSYRTMGETNVSTALAFTVNSSGAVDAGETILSLVADGAHTPTFAAGINLAGTQGYDNTAGRVNNITFFRDFSRYYYGVVLGPITAAPTLLAAAVSNSTPGRIDLTWSQPMNSTISAFSAFAVSSGHTLTAHTYVDSTHTYLTTSANFVNGEAARTLAYTQPGSNKMMDLAAGLLVANFSGASITNNVSDTTAPTFSSAAVQSAAPTIVEVNFSEALLGYPTSGNLPASSAFTVSGHTVSAIAWGTSAAQIKLTVDAFGSSETRTLAYTQPGTNNLSDPSSNLVANFSGQSITDNVVTGYTDTGTSDKFGGGFPNNVNPASDGGTWTIDTGGAGTGSCGPSPNAGLRGSLNDATANPVRYVRNHGGTTQTLSFNWRTQGNGSFVVLRQNGAGGTTRIEVWLSFDTATSQIKETVAGVTSNIGSSFNSVSTFGAMTAFTVAVSGTTVTVKNGSGTTIATATTTVTSGTWSGFHMTTQDEFVNTIAAT